VWYWILAAFIALVFLTGGSSRMDVQSLAILRPVSILICALAVASLKRQQIKDNLSIISVLALIVVIPAVHVIPLPPFLSQHLASHRNVIEVESALAMAGIWSPLTVAQVGGWNALSALVSPIAVILLGIQMERSNLNQLLPLVIGLGCVSAILGLLQIVGSAQSSIYLYEITNEGSAVGLFSNRNHSAIFIALLFPLLAAYAAIGSEVAVQSKGRKIQATAVAIVLVPLVLVTGSRMGLLLSIAGMLAAALLYRQSIVADADTRGRSKIAIQMPLIAIGTVLIGLMLLTFLYSRAVAIDRIFQPSGIYDQRADFWLASIDLMWKYMPFGSGSGSYAEIYKIVEPEYFLDWSYLNQAHNDWMQTMVTLGAPAAALIFTGICGFLYRSVNLWRTEANSQPSAILARTASIMIAILAVASIGDYPLRTPAMLCLSAVLGLWFFAAPLPTRLSKAAAL
jgi:hypothetical protein